LRASDRARAAAVAAAALAVVSTATGCGPKTIVVVEPGLLDGLVGYWRLDDGPDSSTAHDSSGWGNNGTLVDLAPATAWAMRGSTNGTLSPQGMGYVNVVPSTSIDSITDQTTVAAWIFLQGNVVDFATAISRQLGSTYRQQYHLSVNGDYQPALYLDTPQSGQVVMFGAATVPQQTWVHLAATYDGSMARLYLDGSMIDSVRASGAFAPETNPVVLGGNGNGPDRVVSEQVPGQLDEIMLYRRALSADEIARIAKGALLPARPDAGR
jgi:hypothetical protein